jgi:hypothetical protein
VRNLLRTSSLMIVLAASPTLKAGTNKVLNPGFESDLSHWNRLQSGGYSDNWTNGGANTVGSYAVTTSAVVNAGLLDQCVNVQPSTSYSFGFFYKVSSVFPYPYPAGQLGVSWKDGAGCKGTTIDFNTTPFLNSTPDLWQLLAAQNVTSPAGAHSALLVLGVQSTSAGATTSYFDEVFFRGGIIGDADGNGVVDVSDVFFLINYLFAGGPLPYGPVDVNDDLKVNVSDVFYLINYLFAGGPLPL